MKMVLATITLSALVAATLPAAEKDTRVYELRTYYAAPGKLDDLNARFRDHTVKLFAKHGMTNVGYWMPIENPENKLIYLLAFPSKEARDASFKAFGADEAWKTASKKSEEKGKLVAKIESMFLSPTDYSPGMGAAASGDRIIEMRTYTATAGKLDNLNARFRDHTLKLFEKHGMTNLGYFTPLKGTKGADNTLVYFLAHKSVDAAKASFGSFRQDPAWVAARTASETKAGGSLTIAEGGVKSVYMKATDYSPMK